MSRKLEDLTPACRLLCEAWLDACDEEGIEVLITCTLRTQEEQDALWEIGRSKPGRKVTWTRKSRHSAGNAFDFAILHHGKITWDVTEYARPGKIGQDLGLTWGGAWLPPDSCHLEL
jgi:peptidoglycan L-alanyl-D-glutamate endopeptidase CwlK